MHYNLPGILFAIATSISWAIGIFPFTEAARRLGVNPLNHFRLALATLLLLTTSLLLITGPLRCYFHSYIMKPGFG